MSNGMVSRRAALSGAAALPLVGAFAAIPAAAERDDPIFGLIEAHRRAEAAFGDAITNAERLKSDLRKSWVHEEIVLTDDPRWIEYDQAVTSSNWKTEEAAADLVTIQPTTMAGVIALLSYAAEYVERGDQWPDDLEDDDGEEHAWEVFLHRSIARTLGEIAGKAVRS